MYRTTQDVLELRRWAEARAVRPCRDESTGRLVLARPGQGLVCDVGWEEFEPAFLTRHDVCIYDEAPGSALCFVGPPEEAAAFLCSCPAPATGPGSAVH
jgi:hypothetical protein